MPLSGTVHLTGQGCGEESGEAGGREAERGVITAMLRPEREICTHRDYTLFIHRKVGMEGLRDKGWRDGDGGGSSVILVFWI